MKLIYCYFGQVSICDRDNEIILFALINVIEFNITNNCYFWHNELKFQHQILAEGLCINVH